MHFELDHFLTQANALGFVGGVFYYRNPLDEDNGAFAGHGHCQQFFLLTYGSLSISYPSFIL